MVSEKVKSELKRFLSAKQVEELSKQFEVYEKRVRQAVKQFDLKGREAKAKGQVQLDKFTSQVKRRGQELEKQFKSLVNQESKVLNQGLHDLFSYFKTLTQTGSATKANAKNKSRKRATKSRSSKARRPSSRPAETSSSN
jgi:hypothetical protein